MSYEIMFIDDNTIKLVKDIGKRYSNIKNFLNISKLKRDFKEFKNIE